MKLTTIQKKAAEKAKKLGTYHIEDGVHEGMTTTSTGEAIILTATAAMMTSMLRSRSTAISRSLFSTVTVNAILELSLK